MNAEQAIPYIVALAGGWLVAHIIKGVFAYINNRQVSLIQLMFMSGGMPSSHAATSVAVWTVIALAPDSPPGLIGLATLVVFIVCYDAVKVRRSVGEQGEALRALIISQDKTATKLPRAARGHTPLEVIVGSCLGLLIGFVVHSTML